ncbi:MAG: hypothetical protein AABY89_12345, partial [Acidobacteriota bacterium]
MRVSLLSLLAAVVLVAPAAAQPPTAQRAAPALDPPEIRALWVDAFHAGIRSAREADELVAVADEALRRRADAAEG